MADLNKWIGMGRLASSPELKQTPSGISVTSFSVACNRITAKGAEQTADFINIVAWRTTAEFICKYFKKGQAICIEGSIQTRSWTDQRGEKRYATEVVADRVYFAGAKSEAQTQADEYAPSSPSPSFTAASTPNFTDIDMDEDLPF